METNLIDIAMWTLGTIAGLVTIILIVGGALFLYDLKNVKLF